jgi:hypothetical protein
LYEMVMLPDAFERQMLNGSPQSGCRETMRLSYPGTSYHLYGPC